MSVFSKCPVINKRANTKQGHIVIPFLPTRNQIVPDPAIQVIAEVATLGDKIVKFQLNHPAKTRHSHLSHIFRQIAYNL